MIPDLDPATDLGFTRARAAPRRLIRECWTRPQHIPHFFVLRPNRVTSVDMDLRVDGRFNTTFDFEGAVIENMGAFWTSCHKSGWCSPIPKAKGGSPRLTRS